MSTTKKDHRSLYLGYDITVLFSARFLSTHRQYQDLSFARWGP